MKKVKAFFNLMIAMVMVSILITLTNCGKDPEPTAADITSATLTASAWKIQSSTVDDTDQSGLFKNLVITFTPTGYSSVNGGAVWPASGTWSFVDATATSFKRDDGVIVSIDNINETTLTLSLTWTKTTLGGGRAKSISGKNVFVLGK